MRMFTNQQLGGVVLGSACCAYIFNPNNYIAMTISLVMGVVIAHVIKGVVEIVKSKNRD
ncbi:hypothetical protein DC915_RS02265 [Vibrio parahaemolyticus]|nr:hypothetical protein [Vibrio parahaemolyticus]EJG0009800.1 hypothetical protein [Vibrio parahaemolyticus]ELA8176635.1 hypothetical protein [Vibrio alginolyticus]